MNPLNWLVRYKPAPGAEAKSISGSDVLASGLNGLIAFAVAWPATEATLRQLVLVVPEQYKDAWTAGVSSLALLVATGTQLYRMWRHDARPRKPG